MAEGIKMKKSSFKFYDLDQATRKTLSVTKFGGVDLSTQRFLVADNHAIDEKNFIYKNGIIQKRNGWEDLFKVKAVSYLAKKFDGVDTNEVMTNGVNFNGLWKFKAEDGEIHAIAHIGKLLFEINDISSSKIDFSPILYSEASELGNDGLYYKRIYEFEDYKSSAFVGGNKLWFLGGNKFMCLRYLSDGSRMFFPAADGDLTPIPVTTQSITYANSKSSGRASLDNVNLMSKWRKNKLITGTGKSDTEANATEYFDFTLDSPIVCKDEIKDMADFSMTIEERGKVEQ